MSVQQNDENVLDEAASTAQSVGGAIKTGKAIAGAAKGAAPARMESWLSLRGKTVTCWQRAALSSFSCWRCR